MGAPLVAIRPPTGLRPATPRDAATIARLTDMAGEGLPSHVWAGMAAPGQSPMNVGTRRAERETGAFSWRNARMGTWHGAAVGAILDYDLDGPEAAPPASPLFQPLLELEAIAAGTRYVNVLAVLPQARRRGVARALLRDAAARTERDLTLIVASGNRIARGLYVARGFDEVARHAMGPGGPEGLGGDWILMRRPAGAVA